MPTLVVQILCCTDLGGTIHIHLRLKTVSSQKLSADQVCHSYRPHWLEWISWKNAMKSSCFCISVLFFSILSSLLSPLAVPLPPFWLLSLWTSGLTLVQTMCLFYNGFYLSNAFDSISWLPNISHPTHISGSSANTWMSFLPGNKIHIPAFSSLPSPWREPYSLEFMALMLLQSRESHPPLLHFILINSRLLQVWATSVSELSGSRPHEYEY